MSPCLVLVVVSAQKAYKETADQVREDLQTTHWMGGSNFLSYLGLAIHPGVPVLEHALTNERRLGWVLHTAVGRGPPSSGFRIQFTITTITILIVKCAIFHQAFQKVCLATSILQEGTPLCRSRKGGSCARTSSYVGGSGGRVALWGHGWPGMAGLE